MKTVFLLYILISLVSCASQENRWVKAPFVASQINSVVLNASLGKEEYNIFSCSKFRSTGEIRLSNNSSRYFCIAKDGEAKFATIKKSEMNIKICLWKESGFCADGICESISSASDCKEI